MLSGGAEPLAVEWLAAALLYGGAFAAVVIRRRPWRRALIGVSVVGLGLTVAGWVAEGSQPGPAPYGVRIVAPGRATSPDAVFTVCGVLGDGSLTTPTDAQHWLAPFIDGRERPAIDAPVYPIRLTPGVHTVRFDLVTSSMREFAPAASVSEAVAVSRTTTQSGPGRC